ncbi:cohesin domain-containing protein [Paenibacillus anseongense]|uniref:cohesin domain-containing protein n=1 Tax=Paenibacillus TaxID=44249 RepID=UPI002DB6A37A|nr:cohesin domain-containing protein [Paenibacillus anseongense]MEC0270899.1 cohesin domain-containing protein [Paenibacillus anseongense]
MRKRKRHRTYLVYALLMLLSANWFADLSLAKAEEAIHATLSGEDKVLVGEAFHLTYGLKGVTQAVYAQDLTVTYDAEQLSFNGVDTVKELKDQFSIVGLSDTPGRVRIIAVSHGAQYAIREDSELLTLHWSSKKLDHSASSDVSISNLVVSNGDGVETNVSGATHKIQISVDNSQPGDLNGDNKYTIGDLAIAAASYGKTSADSDWAKHVKADVHPDGRIDIADLAIIAKAIMSGSPDVPKPPQWTAAKRLDVSGVSSSGVTLSWFGATDPDGITDYKVYQDGQALGTVTGNVYQYAITSLISNTAYTFKVEAVNASGLWSTNGPSVTVTTQANQPPSAQLNGQGSVVSEGLFTLTYGLKSVTESIYAQDFTLTYEAEHLEFLGVETLREDMSAVIDSEMNGQVHVMLHAGEHPIKEEADLLVLRWKAKSISQPVTTTMTIQDIVLTNTDGLETTISGVSHSVRITLVDLNSDNKISVGDLAVVAAAYGRSSDDQDWAKYERADLNQNGKVDIDDLAMVAKWIFR